MSENEKKEPPKKPPTETSERKPMPKPNKLNIVEGEAGRPKIQAKDD